MAPRFGTQTKRLAKPAICKAPPIPIIAPIIGPPPPLLAGFARWTDLAPIGPIDAAAFIDLHLDVPDVRWYGATPRDPPNLQLVLLRTHPTGIYSLTLTVDPVISPPESAVWPGLHLDPNQAFDTGLLKSIYIPNVDFRIARVTA